MLASALPPPTAPPNEMLPVPDVMARLCPPAEVASTVEVKVTLALWVEVSMAALPLRMTLPV